MFELFTQQPKKTEHELETMTLRYEAQNRVIDMLWDRISAYRKALENMRTNGIITEEEYETFCEDAEGEYNKLRSK